MAKYHSNRLQRIILFSIFIWILYFISLKSQQCKQYFPPLPSKKISTAIGDDDQKYRNSTFPLSLKQWNKRRIEDAKRAIDFFISDLPVQEYNLLAGWQILQLIPETYTCNRNYVERIGGLGQDKDIPGDGGKWICREFFTKNENCVIFSVGSNGDYSFETAINQITEGKCTIHTFDCTGDYRDEAIATSLPNLKFHGYCLSDKNEGPYRRFSELMKIAGTTQVDYLKLDIEGHEWKTLFELFQDKSHRLPAQISFELHISLKHWKYLPENLKALALKGIPDVPDDNLGETQVQEDDDISKVLIAIEAGYHIASVESNAFCSECAEYVIVRPGD